MAEQIKINELATADISLSDFIVKANESGVASKNTIENLATILSTTGDVAFKGKLLIADTPSVDGWYFAGESGTYTNTGSLVVDISNNLVIIIVLGTQTSFSKVDIPLNINIATEIAPGNTGIAVSGDVADYVEIQTDLKVNGLENKLIGDNGNASIPLDNQTNSKRVSADGTIASFSGYQLSDYKSVLEGEVYEVQVVHPVGFGGVIGYSDNSGTFESYLSAGKGDDLTNLLTYQVTIPSGVNFIRVNSYVTNTPTFTLTRVVQDGFLWDKIIQVENSVPEPTTINEIRKDNKEINYKENLEILTPYFGGRRLSNDGTSTSFSGWTTSRYLKVNFGDLILYKGSHPETYAGVVGYSGKNESDFTEHLSLGKGVNLTLSTYYVEVSNKETRYIRVCTQNGTDNVFLNQFEIQIIPANGDLLNRINGASFRNYFPNALSKAPDFVAKYLSGEDVKIVCNGDSLTQFSNQGVNENLSSLPPFMEHKNWVYNLWNSIANNKSDIIYRRSDFAGVFTKTGTYTSIDGAEHSFNNIYSTDTNADFSFDWDLSEYEKTNLVMPRNGVQSNDIRIDVPINKLEFWNGTSWVEANGIVLDLRLSGTAGNILAANNFRHKLRVKSGATGTVTVRVYKNTADADRLQFWGIEQWNGQAIFIANIAYGGFATYELQDGNISNLKDRQPDLVLMQLPLINNYGDRYNNVSAKTLLSNDFEDFIWGERLGFENSLSLKNISNNWTDFEVISIFPHYRYQFMNGNKFRNIIDFGTPTQAYATALESWNLVKKLHIDNNDVEFIDIGAMMKFESSQRGWTLEQSYDGDTGSDMNSNKTFCQDTVHQNLLGSEIWGKYISPIFEFLNN